MATISPFMPMALAALLLGMSCSGTKKQTPMEYPVSEATTGESMGYEVSALTRRFIADIDAELNDKGVEIEHYVPSSSLIERYGLRETEGVVFFSGFIKTEVDFDSGLITAIGGSLGGSSTGIHTVSVPMRHLHDFLQLRGVTYFELATKARN